MPIRIAMLAAECEPWAKTGGLADVVDALARALARPPDRPSAQPEAMPAGLETPVDVFLPRYRGVPVPADAVLEPRLRIADPAGGRPLDVGIVDVAADGYRLRLVDHPPAFDREGYYDHPDDPWRFAVFCRAALEALRRDGRPLDLVHLHDWHTAPALLERQRAVDDPFLGRVASLLTLHNLAYHGWTPLEKLAQLGLRPGDGIVPAEAGGLDLLRSAIERSELANTVSPGFAAEALTAEYGMGLDGVLGVMGDRFFGILNGLDTTVWDPATDDAIAARYSAGNLDGKAACRADLLARVGFDPSDDGAVLGMIGRLDPQKGFDLLADAAPDLVADGARIVVLGSGNPVLAEPFRTLARHHPDRVALLERFDRVMARRIYAGSDLFLMPSRFEPCGQGQMIALRFGTPPIVRRTGGLADSVVDADEARDGTGIVFDEASPEALLAACRRALRLRATEPDRWASLVARGMARDFGWRTGSAPAYLGAYRRAIDLRQRGRGAS